MKRLLTLASLVLLGLANFVHAEQGNPKLKTIEAIAFGPKGLLLIGGGPQVVSVETGDTAMVPWTTDSIANIDQVLAGKLGLTAKDIEVRKLAVNPASGKAYIALQSLKNKASVLLTIDGTGKIAEFPLENVKFTSYSLAVPKGATVTKVTDIAWADGKIVAATQASDKFSASRVFTIDPATTDGAAKQISTKTFHTGHGKWETQAPLRALTPYIENGKASVVGTFTCSPIVRYSIDDAKDNDQVTGNSVVELGRGNTPRSMFTYEKDGKKFLLVSVGKNKAPTYGSPSSYWVAKVDATLLDETKNINEKAPWRDGGNGAGSNLAGNRVQVAQDYAGVQQMDKLDASRALAIIETKDAFSLRALPLP